MGDWKCKIYVFISFILHECCFFFWSINSKPLFTFHRGMQEDGLEVSGYAVAWRAANKFLKQCSGELT
jgi:hypothetical protein